MYKFVKKYKMINLKFFRTTIIIIVLFIIFSVPQSYYGSTRTEVSDELWERYITKCMVYDSEKTDRIYFFSAPSDKDKYIKELSENYDYDKIVVIGDTAYSHGFSDKIGFYENMLKVIDCLLLLLFIALIILFYKKYKLKTRNKNTNLGMFIIFLVINLCCINGVSSVYAKEQQNSIIDMIEDFETNGYPDGIVYIEPIYESEKESNIEIIYYDIFTNTTNGNNIVDFLDELSVEECDKVVMRHYEGTKEQLLSRKDSSNENDEKGIFDVIYTQSSIWYWLFIAFKHFVMLFILFIIIILSIMFNSRRSQSY